MSPTRKAISMRTSRIANGCATVMAGIIATMGVPSAHGDVPWS